MAWHLIKWAGAATVIFVIGVFFGGGGHGWGAGLLFYTFLPVVDVAQIIDKPIRCVYTECPPSLTYEIILIVMVWIGAVLQFAFIGLVFYLIKNRNRDY